MPKASYATKAAMSKKTATADPAKTGKDGTRDSIIAGLASSTAPSGKVTLAQCTDALHNRLPKLKAAYEMRRDRSGWKVDNDLEKRFFNSLPKYCKKVINEKRIDIPKDTHIPGVKQKKYSDAPEYAFYDQYISDKFKYAPNKTALDGVKQKYLTSGASAIISGWDVMNAYGRFGSVGRPEGNFVTSLQEDIKLCTEKTPSVVQKTNSPLGGKTFKDEKTVEEIKGLKAGTYSTGMYMYYYSPEFIQSTNQNNVLGTAHGELQGANPLNIPGMLTWAENMERSESELIVPSITLNKITEPFKMINLLKNGETIQANKCMMNNAVLSVKPKGEVKVIPLKPASPVVETVKQWLQYCEKNSITVSMAYNCLD